MFSTKSIHRDFSRSFAVIRDGKEEVVEVLFFTDHVNVDPPIDEEQVNLDFQKSMRKYCSSETSGKEWHLKKPYHLEVVPHASPNKSTDRFVRVMWGASGSGKSFTIGRIFQRYHEAYTTANLLYASVNDLSNDESFAALRTPLLNEKTGKPVIDEATKKPVTTSPVKEIDVKNLEGPIDVFADDLKGSLVAFDDLDTTMGTITAQDLDTTMTPERFKSLSIKEQGKIMREVNERMSMASDYIKETVKSIINNGRKQKVSMCYVFHQFFQGTLENMLISEATSLMVFPTKLSRAIFARWLKQKVHFSKEEIQWITSQTYYLWDFLEIDKASGSRFLISNRFLKMF